ncbi:MAG TPA: hypothetical protein VFX70_15040 [Mycobacteriales bacterium]|nr:hypothetical protein [Mycobacteriales bacterium]
MSNTAVEVPAGRSRRRIITITVAIVMVMAVGVVIGLWRTVGQRLTERHLTLSILDDTTWDPNVLVSYDDVHPGTVLLHLEMSDVPAAARAAVIDNIWIQPRAVPGAAGVAAHVDVATLGPVRPDAAVASILASERQLADPAPVRPMTDLPAGWKGIVWGTESGNNGDAEVVGVAGAELVRISIKTSIGAISAPTAIVARDATQLVTAIARWGIPRFSNVVVQPHGWF